MSLVVNGHVIKLVKGDITSMNTDAIVNAANERLAHGGGVAGAILRKGGSIIQKESDDWVTRFGPVHTGTAAITSGGQLKAKYVIHAVGPVMGSGNEKEKLRLATQSAMVLAEKFKLRSLAFPAISTGIYGYPAKQCAEVMLRTVVAHLEKETCLDLIIFCLFDEFTFQVFENEIDRIAQSDKAIA